MAEAGSHTLTLLPSGRQVPVAEGQSLLQAALAAGLRLPSACRNGTCRSCMVRLMNGQVHYRIEWPGLLAEEKAEGWVLPCVAQASSDLALWLDPQSAQAPQPTPAPRPAGPSA